MSLAINFEKQKKSKDVSKDEGRGRLNAVLVFAVEKKSHIGRCLNFSTSKTEKEKTGYFSGSIAVCRRRVLDPQKAYSSKGRRANLKHCTFVPG